MIAVCDHLVLHHGKTDAVSDQHLESGKASMEAGFSNVHSLPAALLKITSVT